MKIILATALYPPEIDNISSYVRDLVKYLQPENQITVLTYANQVIKTPGAGMVIVNKKQPLALRLFKYTLKLLKISKQADIIYVQNSIAAGLPAIVVKWFRKISVIVNFNEDETYKRAFNLHLTTKTLEQFLIKPQGGLKINLLIFLQGLILRQSSVVVVPSAESAKLVGDVYRVGEKKIKINYPVKERHEILPFTPKIISHQIFTTNCPDTIVQALALVKERFADVKLIMAGDRKNNKELIKKLNLTNNINFLGRISSAEAWYLRQSSQIYIHNSSGIDELLQSFLAGIPVIATDTALIRDLFSNYQCGLVVKFGGIQELAETIDLLFTRPATIQKIINNAKENLQARFSWQAHLSKLKTIFELAVK